MAKEALKGNKLNETALIIDGNNHENNMKYRIIFLIKIIPKLYPKFDFFSWKKFISEVNKDIIEDSSKEKIAI